MKNLTTIAAGLSRFDCIAKVSSYPGDDTLPASVDITFWGSPDERELDEVERECREAGLTLEDSYTGNLGLHRQYVRPVGIEAKAQVREAMEAMCGSGHVALACAPVAPLTDADLDEMARRNGDAGDARQHTLTSRRPINPHGD